MVNLRVSKQLLISLSSEQQYHLFKVVCVCVLYLPLLSFAFSWWKWVAF